MAQFQLNTEDLEKLKGKIGQLNEHAEDEINAILHTESIKEVPRSVQQLINISAKRKGTHARQGRPFKAEPFNLGFFVQSYPRYGYLIFPDEGRGIRNPVKQDFTQRGIDKEHPKIVNKLLEGLTKRIQKEL